MSKAGEFLHHEDHLNGPYELKAPANPQYENVELAGGRFTNALEIGILAPEGFDRMKPYPVMLCFGGGPGQRFNWEDWCARYFEVSRARGLARDWLLLAPIAPKGEMFMRDLAADVPRLCEALRARYNVEGGRFHIAGQSNGGNAAFTAAMRTPELFASLTVHTGVAKYRRPEDLKRLCNLPIFMYCGDQDCFGFNDGMEELSRALLDAGHPPEHLEFVNFSGIGHFGILDVLTSEPRLEEFWRRMDKIRNRV
eukprot:gnl/TRDRNA2_/TRDRNA2_59240_c0_seq1.p1 gnl/TRDRNA2_/TRDRNA2_59240_c0~~gnl/TRDRNA2_/TRDRNA2_59240_c0_seq1.p1  ORF type:complete len:253 (+),score=41.72 gnl/TRDRNA2_/TRDRNA2_59240_c0_seq1:67-825(+)